MSESEQNQIFLTAIPDETQLQSIIIHNDDDDIDIDIDVKSSADSEESPMASSEIRDILTKNQSQEFSSIIVPNTVNDALQDKM